jgi:hypothetical protein
VACKIEANTIYRCNGHGISVDAGTTQNTDYSRRCRVTDNLVDRSAAASTAQDTFAGNLLHVGGGTELCTFADNILYDNATQGADDSGIGWSHSSGGRPWRSNTFEGNIVTLADGIGIEVVTGSIYTGNIVNKSATHGMRFVGSGAPSSIDRTLIATNYIVDSNEDAVSATRIHGISIHLHADMKSLSNVLITNNLVGNTNTNLKYALGIVKATGVTGETITGIQILGNEFRAVDVAAVDWAGDGATDVPLGAAVVTKFRWRDNGTKDDYSGEATLSGGTIAVQNTNWPPFTNLVFNLSRRSAGSGVVSSTYLDDTLTISATTPVTIPCLNADAWPTAVSGSASKNIKVVEQSGVTDLKSPGAYEIDTVHFKTGGVTGGGSIDVFIRDEPAENRLTDAVTVNTGDDNVFFTLSGNGTATTKDAEIRVDAENEAGAGVDGFTVTQAFFTFSATPAGSGTVWWEFLGTKD